MRILIVSAFFPPQNTIASLRPYSWAKYWNLAGNEITILTTKKNPTTNDLKLDNSSFKLIEIPLKIPFRKANDSVNVVQQEMSEKDVKKKNTIKITVLTFLKKQYKKIINKTGCFLVCRFPDWHDKWIKDAMKQINPDDYDVLVSTGGPYSVHRAGLMMRKKGWQGKWICDWRDLFTKNHLYPGLKIFHLYEKSLERKIHNKADIITTVSIPATEALSKITQTPVYTIYNGFDEDDFAFLFQRERKENSKFVISYLGSVYRGFQDPEPLFQAIDELDEEGVITTEDIIVQFAGSESADVSDLAVKHNVENYFKYLGFLPREKSLELQYNSDVVLFLEYENPKVKGVMTGKLFEYLYIARYIMAVGCSNKITAGELIEKCNAGECFGYDVKKIKEFITKSIEAKKTGSCNKSTEKNISEIQAYSRRIQAEKMIELIKKS